MLRHAYDDQSDAADVSDRSAAINDTRFRTLIGKEAWAHLPIAIQRRFSKRLMPGASTVYRGRVTAIEISRIGMLLAQVLRLVGAPLPLSRQIGAPTVVSVTEERSTGGQNWTRIFGHAKGFPQVIHSTKRFSGPTGLEEYVGSCICMALTVTAERNAIIFRSAGYAINIGSWRIPIPRLFTPGDITVTHREVDPATFLFTLHIEHRWLGTLVHQEALYAEDPACLAA